MAWVQDFSPNKSSCLQPGFSLVKHLNEEDWNQVRVEAMSEAFTTSDDRRTRAGCLRTNVCAKGHFEAPPSILVPEELSKFLAWSAS
jgi:hypothetical protein